jgi:hypothetical protein
MKINPLLIPVILLANFIEWVRNLFKPKPKPKPVESASRWPDTVMAEVMDSTIGDTK